MLNKVHLIGNLGNDIEIHQFENGDCIGKVSLATSSSYTNKQTGERVVNTQWHNLVFRNKAAQNMEKYTTKGDQIHVEGTIKYREYEVNGEKKYITEITVLNSTFLKTKRVDNAPVNAEHVQAADDNSDLPF